MFTSLYSKGVITRFPSFGFGRGGDATGGFAFCGVLKTRLGLGTHALRTRGGDAVDARTVRARGGEKLKRREFMARADELCVSRGDALMLGGRTLVSLTTVTPDAFMKF